MEEARSLNAHLDSILAKLKRIHTHLLDSEEEITAETQVIASSLLAQGLQSHERIMG
ncbi:MAG: hypothetical protein JWQ54_390 [Mucilaginibacter sp.]|nr:hypothetical protein [Mucilaginibacter sp.]